MNTTLTPRPPMCKHCDNFDLKAAATAATPTAFPANGAPPWVEKLGGVILPASLMAMVAGFALMICEIFGSPVHFNPKTVWIIRVYAGILILGTWVYISAAIWHGGFRRDWRTLKAAIRWLSINRETRSISLRLASIENELELAQEDYCGGAHATSRAPELSREIVRLTEYRDALQDKLDRLMIELREARLDRFG